MERYHRYAKIVKPPLNTPSPSEPEIARPVDEHPSGLSRDRLLISPIVWVAIGLLVLLGIRAALLDTVSISDSPRAVLNYRGRGEWVPVRRTATDQRFETLGVRVRMPVGWTFLAKTDNDRSIRPTFVNESCHSIIQLFPAAGLLGLDAIEVSDDAPNAEKSEGSIAVSRSDLGLPSPRVRWARVSNTVGIEVSIGDGDKMPLVWNFVDPRRIGQWSDGPHQVGVIAIADPFLPRSTQAIEDFCDTIAPWPASPDR